MRVSVAGVVVLLLSGCGLPPEQQELTAEEASALPMRVLVFDYRDRDGAAPLRLAPHEVMVPRADDVAAAAVRALIRDVPAPGRSSLWHGMCRLADDVASVERTDVVVTVRVVTARENVAACDLTEDGRLMQRQQIAWGLRAALGTSIPVRVLGREGDEVLPVTSATADALEPGVLAEHPSLQVATSSPTNTPTA